MTLLRLIGWLFSLVTQTVKESTCNAGDPGSFPVSVRPLEKRIATHFSISAWRIPRTEEPDGVTELGIIERLTFSLSHFKKCPWNYVFLMLSLSWISQNNCISDILSSYCIFSDSVCAYMLSLNSLHINLKINIHIDKSFLFYSVCYNLLISLLIWVLNCLKFRQLSPLTWLLWFMSHAVIFLTLCSFLSKLFQLHVKKNCSTSLGISHFSKECQFLFLLLLLFLFCVENGFRNWDVVIDVVVAIELAPLSGLFSGKT